MSEVHPDGCRGIAVERLAVSGAGPAREFLLRIAEGQAVGAAERLAAAALGGLSALYRIGLEINLAAYRLRLLRVTRLSRPVVSVGNLSLGGTGKTSAACAIVGWLRDQGLRPAVLSRGYRGGAETRGVVVSRGGGPVVPVAEAGDEPYLMAQKLPGVAVVVGKDRRETGRLAIEELGADVLVLDDGYQYWRLHKDIEVCLVDATRPLGAQRLFPRGLLREPASHLRRATAVWITHAEAATEEALAAARRTIAAAAPEAPILATQHRLLALRTEAGERLAPETLAGRRVLALSSIGNPAAFERGLAGAGAQHVVAARYPDHHPYRREELAELVQRVGARVEVIVTTEKDKVRLPSGDLGRPVWTAEIELAAAGPTVLEEEIARLWAARARQVDR